MDAATRFVRWVPAPGIFLVLLTLAAPRVPGQSCYENCQNTCRDISGHVNSGCVDNCNRAYCSSSGNSQPHPYGSIAFSFVTAGEGISWGKATQAEADRAALASCTKVHPNCKIVFQYKNTCAALAVAKGAEHVLAATADTEKKAADDATRQCRLKWGVCLADLSACSP